MADIFVSYSQVDRERVRPIVDALGAQGFTVWLQLALITATATPLLHLVVPTAGGPDAIRDPVSELSRQHWGGLPPVRRICKTILDNCCV